MSFTKWFFLLAFVFVFTPSVASAQSVLWSFQEGDFAGGAQDYGLADRGKSLYFGEQWHPTVESTLCGVTTYWARLPGSTPSASLVVGYNDSSTNDSGQTIIYTTSIDASAVLEMTPTGGGHSQSAWTPITTYFDSCKTIPANKYVWVESQDPTQNAVFAYGSKTLTGYAYVSGYTASRSTSYQSLSIGYSSLPEVPPSQDTFQSEVDSVKASSTGAIKSVGAMYRDIFYSNWLYIVLGILAIGIVLLGTFYIGIGWGRALGKKWFE